MSDDHPLRDYIGPEVFERLQALCQVSLSESSVKAIETQIIANLPQFVYLPSLDKVSDRAPIQTLAEGNLQESDRLLGVLLRSAGLHPESTVKMEQAERLKSLREKSDIIAERLREHWFSKDMNIVFDFLNQDLDIGVAIDSAGSFDPPSRRSQGFGTYLSLFAKLAELVEQNIVLLLDDPAVHLHPVAQEKVLGLLESQPFQIILATHLPFMIDPERLERVRVVKRTAAGSQIEQDWGKAQETLKLVWGSLLTHYTGGVWLLVEGMSDREYYLTLSDACKNAGKEYLSNVVVIPAGGDQLPYVALALHCRGIPFIAIMDGDKPGQNIKERVLQLCNVQSKGIVSLSEVGLSETTPTAEDLFSAEFKRKPDVRHKGLLQAVRELQTRDDAFDEETLNRFAKVFAKVNEGMPPGCQLAS